MYKLISYMKPPSGGFVVYKIVDKNCIIKIDETKGDDI